MRYIAEEEVKVKVQKFHTVASTLNFKRSARGEF